MPIPLRRTAPSLLLAAALGACAGQARAPGSPALLLQDGFDGENGERPVLMYHRFQQWEVAEGTVDLIGAGSEWDFVPGNGLYVDLDGDRPDGVRFEPGVLVSRAAFDLRPGVYTLRFRLAGSQRGDANTVEVRLGEAHRERIALASDSPFRVFERRIRVTRPEQARLSFDNEGADGYGLLLDDVSLRRVR